jgi:phosphoglycolate phosphatase-like HAD superfamily hydrolase
VSTSPEPDGEPLGEPGDWAVFDIDGVLADVRHRLHHLRRTPSDWRGFFAAADADPPLPEGVALLRRQSAAHPVAYVTGRPEFLRRVTRTWLDAHDLPPGPLLMRGHGDHRPARIVKLELLVQLTAQAPIALVVDDDSEVVATLREVGLTVRHATWVVRDATLREAQDETGRT